MKEHDWGPESINGIRSCTRKDCGAEWAVAPVVKGRPYWKIEAKGWSKSPGKCEGTS